jgi:hypothetical protein
MKTLWRTVRASRAERARALPGDSLIASPIGSLTHAITIRRPPCDVWPWLVQMGAGSRAGWYSYDRIDNGRQPSAASIRPELQHPAVGTVFPALPGVTDGFVLLDFEVERFVVLGWPDATGTRAVTWAFLLDRAAADSTRLIVRARGGADYRFHRCPKWATRLIIQAIHFIMQRKQLIGIARRAEDEDQLLDRFVPVYEMAERHHISVAAPPATTLAAAREMDLQESRVVRAIVKARELILGATPDDRPRPRGLLAEMQSLGWGILAEIPGREIVAGAVTQPWEANVVFRALPPEDFAAFEEPGYVKIAWTLRADPVGATRSVFRTETRVAATDPSARRKFRRYWSMFSPGIRLIRWAILGPLKREAEYRARAEEALT